jgi:hypothetical protein
MISRLSIALPIAVLGAALFAQPAPAQVRGMRASGRAPRAGFSFGPGVRTYPGPRRYFGGSAFLPVPYYPDYDSADYEPISPEAPPVQILVEGSPQPAAPAAVPTESLLLENRDGQWVRIPTGGQLPVQSVQPDSAQAPNAKSSGTSREDTAQPSPAVPAAVLVFRDGHKEEVARYTIVGEVIYASTDRWSTGSWTKKISVAELDVPATLKLNEERGGKFGLPSRPSEVMVRF